MNYLTKSVDQCVNSLLEKSQPIYGHDELSAGVTDLFVERLNSILNVHDTLQKKLQKPLKVLDLGCSQGFFSLSLAKKGAIVQGVDYRVENIDVCNALLAEHSDFKANFCVARIEDIIQSLSSGQYDLVLGLNVFQQIIFEKGIDEAKKNLIILAEKVNCLLLEFSGQKESVCWERSSPKKIEDLINDIAFFYKLGDFPTPSGALNSSLYFASNKYWFLDSDVQEIVKWSKFSHCYDKNNYFGSRRYYVSEDRVLKLYHFVKSYAEINKHDLVNEIRLLSNKPSNFTAPDLISSAIYDDLGWLIQKKISGILLIDLINSGEDIDSIKIVRDLLEQLATLESHSLYCTNISADNIKISSGGDVSLLDLVTIVSEPKDQIWPHNVYYRFLLFVFELTNRKVFSNFFTYLVSPIEYKQPFRSWAISLWSTSPDNWTFALMHHKFIEILGSIQCQQPLNITYELSRIVNADDSWVNTFSSFNSKNLAGAYELYIDLNRKLYTLENEILEHKKHTLLLQNYIAKIQNSKSWKIANKLRNFPVVLKKTLLKSMSYVKKNAFSLIMIFVDIIIRNIWLERALLKLSRQLPFLHSKVTAWVALAKEKRMTKKLRSCFHPPKIDTTLQRPQSVIFAKPKGERCLYIYVDHTIRFQSNTGVQRITRTFARGLRAIGENIKFVKWDPNEKRCVLINFLELQQLALWNGPEISDDDKDIYLETNYSHNTSNFPLAGENNWLIVPEVTYINTHNHATTLDLIMWAKRSNLRSGFVFYDAIPLFRPELSDTVAIHSMYMQHLLLADAIWPISNWSKDDLINYWLDYQLINKSTTPDVVTQSLPVDLNVERATNVQDGKNIILSVGSITPHKNQIILINAFLDYCEDNPETSWRLVLVGNLAENLATKVANACKTGYVEYLGNVSDSILSELYTNCAFTVFPSVQEGFGLPILESLWYGKPCVCANFGSMAEVAQDGGCLQVDTRDMTALKQAIIKLIVDRDFLCKLCEEAVTRPIKTTFEYVAEISKEIDKYGCPITRLGKIYYWIDSTLECQNNSGIQRVSRQLARAWLDLGAKLIPVKWCDSTGKIVAATEEDLRFFAKWSGPKPEAFQSWVSLETEDSAWLFIPELTVHKPVCQRQKLLHIVKSYNLKIAAIFFDAIPWKMQKLYPEIYAVAYKKYMSELYEYDLILPISKFSANDLTWFFVSHLPRPLHLTTKIKTVCLPEEFTESARVRKKSRPADPNNLNILCVGTIEPRKNHELFLEAFLKAGTILKSHNIALHLTMVGSGQMIDPELVKRVKTFVDANPNIIWYESADDDTLKELYQKCDFTVYPSVEEGFGLPILESLWFAKPCIAANFGSMAEVAKGGGVLGIDMRDAEAITYALVKIASESNLYDKLAAECVAREFKTWQDYAREVSMRLSSCEKFKPRCLENPRYLNSFLQQSNLPKRPKLSVCITTYNRAEWLACALKNWVAQHPQPIPGVEFLVCDNASTDNTADIVKPYLVREDFSYYRNLKNVGMLGNLRETANHASGEYIWILGDDDVLIPGAIPRVLEAINEEPRPALVYLNYAYTKEDDARNVKDMHEFFQQATPIVPPGPNRKGFIKNICYYNENFFTAIYTLVLRRDHAIKAYSQDTSGRPFSSMLTCIPTTYYVLNNMMDEYGIWLGEPQLVVNMNVSWSKYAPLWILERIPEVYEVAEQKGVSAQEMDKWWSHTLPGAVNFFEQIYQNDPLGNAEFFDPEIFVRRFKHLPEFKNYLPRLRRAYQLAYDSQHIAARLTPDNVFH